MTGLYVPRNGSGGILYEPRATRWDLAVLQLGRLAGDAMRDWIQRAAINISGVDPVGGGGSPPVSPSSLSQSTANATALGPSKRSRRHYRLCRQYNGGACTASGAGYRCTIANYAVVHRRRVSCFRRVFVSGSDTAVRHRAVSRRRC